MQLNVGLDKKNKEKAAVLRAAKYPKASEKQIRDSFLFDECISQFSGDMETLKEYIDNEKNIEVIKRNITLKNTSYNRLKEMAEILETPVACVLRALINFSVDSVTNNIEEKQEKQEIDMKILREKILFLEKKIKDIEEILTDLKKCVDIDILE